MILNRTTTKNGNVYAVTIDRLDVDYWLTLKERDTIKQTGHVLVDLGGIIPYGDEDTLTLPTNEQYFPLNIPFVQKFDATDDEDAEAKATGWKTEITTRLTAAMTDAVGAYQDTYDEIEILTINT